MVIDYHRSLSTDDVNLKHHYHDADNPYHTIHGRCGGYKKMWGGVQLEILVVGT